MALRDVNLIPAGLLAHRGMLRHLCFWAGCLIVFILMIFGFFVYQARVIRAQQPALQSLDEIQQQLGQSAAEIQRIQAELQRLDQQRAVLDTITRNRSYCHVLGKLAGVFDEETWLTQLTIERIPEQHRAIRLGLTGLSLSNATLGKFINQLSGDPLFNDVQLVYAKEGRRQISKANSDKLLKLIQFEIESVVFNSGK